MLYYIRAENEAGPLYAKGLEFDWLPSGWEASRVNAGVYHKHTAERLVSNIKDKWEYVASVEAVRTLGEST